MKRREFVGFTAGAVAGLSLGGVGMSKIWAARKNKKLGVALVGLGYYSTDILALALQMTTNCYLAGIVTGTPSKAEAWKKKYNLPDKNIYDYDSFDSISNNPEIDVVYVVLPTAMHAEYSIRAANAGKHVWCEKPMAMTVKECQAMIDAANKNRVKLSIGYRMQHEPNTQTIIRYGREKKFGAINYLTASGAYFDGRSDHWKQKKAMGGGAMYDMGVYPLNAARYITGENPVAVSAEQHTNRPEIYTEVDETMLFRLEFPGGAVANCVTSLGMRLNTLQVYCSNGWYRLEPFQSYSGIKGETSTGEKLDASIPNQQAQQMDNDARAIIEDRAVLVPGKDGLEDIRVVEATYKSAGNGGKRVVIG